MMMKSQKQNKTESQQIQKPQKSRFHLGRFLLFVFLVSAFAASGWQLYQLQQQVNGKLAQLNTDKEKLLQEKSTLEKEIVKLNTPSYIEQLAREQLGLVRKGEIMISPKKQ